jgi:putative addiction module CopG family antidote
MGYHFPADVKQLVETQMAGGHYASEDDLLRDALKALSAEESEVEAIRAALAELDAGDPGISIDEAFDQIRRESRRVEK